METIGFVKEDDLQAIEQMKPIWRECFEADEGYLKAYFSTGYQPHQTVVFRDGDQILGMLTLLPCRYRGICQGKVREYRAAYLFAVATLPAAQGRQIASRMLHFADEALQKQEVELALLAPADEGLYRFYQKRGYETWFKRRLFSFLPKQKREKKDACLKQLTLTQYYPEHVRLLPEDTIVWDEDILRFAEQESILYGGGLYALMRGEEQIGICNIYRYKEDEVIVKELLPQTPQLEEEAIEMLRDIFADSSVYVRLAAKPEEGTPSGMIRFYGKAEDKPQNTGMAYLPFLLD